MKFLLTTIILVHLNQLFAQGWEQQISNTSNDLFAVDFIDANYGCAVGKNGTIITTMDGGLNWTPQNSGTTDHFYDVHFLNSLDGLAVTSNSVYKTNDGGINWSYSESLSTIASGKTRIYFINSSIGFVAKYGNILMTLDGGNTWREKSCPNLSLGFFLATDTLNFYIGGGDGMLLESHNSGENWDALNTPFSSSFYESACVTPNGTHYYVGHTIAFGQYLPLYIQNPNQGSFAFQNWLYAVHFIGDEVGFIAGLDGKIYKTSDEGISWVEQESGVLTSLLNIDFPTTTTGYIVGENGTIIKTTNSGEVGLHENQSTLKEFNAYPNPSTNKLTLTIPNLGEVVNIEISDSFGKIVKSFEFFTSNISCDIDINDLVSGIYIVRLVNSSDSYSKQIIKL